jgi:hypothetical protein
MQRHAYAGGSIVLVLALALIAGCQSPAQVRERLVRFAEEVTFGGPFDSDIERARRVMKGIEPIRVRISGNRAADHRAEVERVLDRVSELTGIAVRVIPEGAAGFPNFNIHFVASRDFAVRDSFVPCYAAPREDGGVISRVEIRISTVDKDRIEGCIAHEIVHGFGLGYHSGIVRSVLSPVHDVADITRWDALVLEALYDGRVQLDMSREEASAVFSEVIAEILAKP